MPRQEPSAPLAFLDTLGPFGILVPKWSAVVSDSFEALRSRLMCGIKNNQRPHRIGL